MIFDWKSKISGGVAVSGVKKKFMPTQLIRSESGDEFWSGRPVFLGKNEEMSKKRDPVSWGEIPFLEKKNLRSTRWIMYLKCVEVDRSVLLYEKPRYFLCQVNFFSSAPWLEPLYLHLERRLLPICHDTCLKDEWKRSWLFQERGWVEFFMKNRLPFALTRSLQLPSQEGRSLPWQWSS